MKKEKNHYEVTRRVKLFLKNSDITIQEDYADYH